MSNLFSRIKYTVSAELNDLMDQKEKKNPIALLNQYLRESEQQTEKVKTLVERQYLLKEEFTREYEEAKQMAEKRAYQVEVASKAGEVELYDFALAEKNHYEERAARLEEAIRNADIQLNKLEKKYMDMKHKLKDMQLRRMEIMGRENVAKANRKMDHVLGNEHSGDQATKRFDEMDQYLSKLENKVNEDYMRSTIDARIAELEKQAKNQESGLIS
ncbi:PspA/IM30 family protein [Bacillus testis]|uniref:PspA/IM30 family protein n=1 Tax=Bacillus testis TaxID=1622072 RepID=UPI00067EA8B0|nr:PspA/IM30 family protein [Bacillus testis]